MAEVTRDPDDRPHVEERSLTLDIGTLEHERKLQLVATEQWSDTSSETGRRAFMHSRQLVIPDGYDWETVLTEWSEASRLAAQQALREMAEDRECPACGANLLYAGKTNETYSCPDCGADWEMVVESSLQRFDED